MISEAMRTVIPYTVSLINKICLTEWFCLPGIVTEMIIVET